MRNLLCLLALGAAALGAASCSHDNMVTNPSGAQPVVANIQPMSEVAGGMLIFAGTHFDEKATFDLRQGGVVKATLGQVLLATGTPSQGIQINATIPLGTAAGKYQACVTTSAGTGCGPVLVEVF